MARIAGTHCALAPDSSDQMAWRIGDHGFLMRLSPEVPPTLGEHAAPFVGELTRRAGLDETTRQFAVHPGGRAIVDAVADALAVERSELESSYSVLRDYGNMSSATILFVLDRELVGEPAPAPLTALAFGPGLTIEGAVLEPPS
jgi:predicted naringenin-chalcone synthase